MPQPNSNTSNLRDLLSALRRGLIDSRSARSAVASGASVMQRFQQAGPMDVGKLADLLGLDSAQQNEADLLHQIQHECRFLEEVPFQPGERIGGRYEVLEILNGGFGLVYLCRGLGPERYRRGDSLAALKSPLPHHVANPDLCEQFITEAMNSVALGPHPNLVLAYGVETYNRIPFLVMEHIAGGRTLAAEIAAGRTDWRSTLLHGLGIARGLAHAFHEAWLVHGDLKPANVLITHEGIAKVSDFGLSLTGGDRGPDGVIAGTDGFMAPEMLARRSGRSTAADVYAFGVTLLCSILGRHPGSSKPADLCTAEHMPEPFAAILRECVAVSPSSRPSGFAEIVSRLETIIRALLGTEPPHAVAPDAPLQADASVNAAQTWLNLGQPRKAAAEVNRALRLNPRNWKAHQIQSCIQLEQRDFESAFRSASKAHELAPDEPVPVANLAQAALKLGHPDEALGWIDQAVRLALESDRMGELDGSSHLIVDMFPPEQATRLIDAILDAQPDAAITWNNRAILMRRMKRPDEALASADRAIALNAAYAKAWVNRANALVELRRFAEAQASASQAIDLDPCLAGAYCAKATALAQMNRLPEARAVIRSGLSFLPDDPLLQKAKIMFDR